MHSQRQDDIYGDIFLHDNYFYKFKNQMKHGSLHVWWRDKDLHLHLKKSRFQNSTLPDRKIYIL